MVDIDYTEIPKSCDTCPHAIENIEEQYDRTGVWYECKLVDGGCNPGERLKNCPLQVESEEEE